MYTRLNTPGILEYFAIVINADNNCKELWTLVRKKGHFTNVNHNYYTLSTKWNTIKLNTVSREAETSSDHHVPSGSVDGGGGCGGGGGLSEARSGVRRQHEMPCAALVVMVHVERLHVVPGRPVTLQQGRRLLWSTNNGNEIDHFHTALFSEVRIMVMK